MGHGGHSLKRGRGFVRNTGRAGGAMERRSLSDGDFALLRRVRDALDPTKVLAKGDPRLIPTTRTKNVHLRSRCRTPDADCNSPTCPGWMVVTVPA